MGRIWKRNLEEILRLVCVCVCVCVCFFSCARGVDCVFFLFMRAKIWSFVVVCLSITSAFFSFFSFLGVLSSFQRWRGTWEVLVHVWHYLVNVCSRMLACDIRRPDFLSFEERSWLPLKRDLGSRETSTRRQRITRRETIRGKREECLCERERSWVGFVALEEGRWTPTMSEKTALDWKQQQRRRVKSEQMTHQL